MGSYYHILSIDQIIDKSWHIVDKNPSSPDLITAALDRAKNTIINKKRTVSPVTLKLIMPTHMCGVILGKSGATAEELRNKTGAKLDITNELLVNSTERLVICSGDPEETAIVCQKIMELLLMNEIRRAKLEQKYGPPKKPIVNTPYEPRVVSKYLKMSKKQEKRSKREMENDEKMAALQLAYRLADKNGIPPPSRNSKGLKTKLLGLNKQLLYVQEINIGAIIGPNGSRIQRVRDLSKCHIIIQQPLEGEDRREIILEGQQQKIQMANYLINCCNDLYGSNSSGLMNNPYAVDKDGNYTSQLGDWLQSNHIKPEEEILFKSFFATYQQKLDKEEELKRSQMENSNNQARGFQKPSLPGKQKPSQRKQKRKNQDPKLKDKFSRSNVQHINQQMESEFRANRPQNPEEYLEKVKDIKKLRSKKHKNSDKRERKSDGRIKSNKELLEEMQRELFADQSNENQKDTNESSNKNTQGPSSFMEEGIERAADDINEMFGSYLD